MDYDHDIGESYDVVSLTIYCKAAKGSFPRYQWFLNKTLLDDRGSFYSVDHQPPQQSILMLSVGWRSAGTYHCSVSDSFDHTTARRSKRVYLDKHGTDDPLLLIYKKHPSDRWQLVSPLLHLPAPSVLNRIPILVATVVFGCFTAMILVVSVCCFLGVVFSELCFHNFRVLFFYLVWVTSHCYCEFMFLLFFQREGIMERGLCESIYLINYIFKMVTTFPLNCLI